MPLSSDDSDHLCGNETLDSQTGLQLFKLHAWTSSLPALERYPPILTGSPSPGIQRDQAEWHCQAFERLLRSCRRLREVPPDARHLEFPSASSRNARPNSSGSVTKHPISRLRLSGHRRRPRRAGVQPPEQPRTTSMSPRTGVRPRALLGLADRAQSVNHVSGVLASSMTRRSSARKSRRRDSSLAAALAAAAISEGLAASRVLAARDVRLPMSGSSSILAAAVDHVDPGRCARAIHREAYSRPVLSCVVSIPAK